MNSKYFGFALGAVLAFGAAAPLAFAQATLNVIPFELSYTEGEATAEWSNAEFKNGSHSIYLQTTGEQGAEGRIRIEFPTVTTLEDITSISWWTNTVGGYPAHLDITLETNDVNQSMLTAEMAYNNGDWAGSATTGQWLQTFELAANDGAGEINDNTVFWVAKLGAGDQDAPWGTLANWKAGQVANDPGGELSSTEINSSTPVSFVEIEIDNWINQSEAYVDGITVNGVTYYGLIQDAINAATSGDTVNVAAGTYTEPIARVAACGNEPSSLCIDKSLTLRGDPGDAAAGPGSDAPVLDGAGLDDGSAIALLRDGSPISNVIIEGFIIRNYTNPNEQGGTGSGVIAWNTDASSITIQDNSFEDLGWNGVLVGSDDDSVQSGWTVQNNVIDNAAYAGVELTNVTNSTVSGNTITVSNGTWDVGDSGVGIEVAVRDNGTGVTAGDTIGVTVSGNTITGGGADARAGINILSRAYQATSDAWLMNVTIEDNTVDGITPRGILVAAEQRNGGAASIAALHLSGNTVSNNEVGIAVGVPTGSSGVNGGYELLVNGNSVSGNTGSGVQNASGVLFDATNNWWDDATGPSGEGTGSGDMVSTDVSFLPWYGNSSFLPPGTVPAPVISPESSSFRVSVDVTIGDSVSGSTVHYTTDGTTPTCSSDTYTDGQVLHFSQPVTVNAIRCDSGGAAVPSAVSSATYTIANSGGGGGGTATAATVAQAATTPAATQTATTPAVTTPAGQVLGAEAFNFTGDLHMSSSGSDVTELQKVLIAAGFDIPAITKGGIAYGYFGGQTLAAVIAYQKANGVTSTGYVGTLTRAVLNKGATPSTGTAATSAAGTKPMFTKALTVGVRDADVTALQQYLTDNGFYSGPVTGYFGTLTKAAVQIYQKEKGIAQTGVVGPLTRAELNKGKVTTTNSAAGSTVLTGSATTTPASGMSAY